MKNGRYKLLLLFLLLLPFQSKSQQIDNAGFDSLCVCAIDRVWQWVTSDTYYISQDTAHPFQPNTFYDNASFNIHFAINTVQLNYDGIDSVGYINSVKILTRSGLVYDNGDIFKGFIINGEHFYTDAAGHIDLKRCGTPFAFRPDSVSVWYKFEDTLSAIAESGKIMVLLKKFNSITHSTDTIGYAGSTSGLSSAAQWTRYAMPIHYISSYTPDSVVLALFSTSGPDQPATLWVDNIRFIYSSSGTHIHNNDANLVVYPNPSGDCICFSSDMPQFSQYTICDSRAITVQSGNLKKCIDIRSLDKGWYMIKVNSNNNPEQIFKFIKM